MRFIQYYLPITHLHYQTSITFWLIKPLMHLRVKVYIYVLDISQSLHIYVILGVYKYIYSLDWLGSCLA